MTSDVGPPPAGRIDPGLPRSIVRHRLSFLFVTALLAASLPGCEKPVTRLEIESFKPGATGVKVVEQFDETWFSSDQQGHWDIVLVARRPSAVETGGELVETLHVRVIWRPVPGKTAVERTQNNANFCYALVDVDRAISYEGAGFVSFSLDERTGELRGEIESGALNPGRVAGDAPDVLGQCLVSGRFVARRDTARVVEIRNEVRRRLGQPRKYRPPIGETDVR